IARNQKGPEIDPAAPVESTFYKSVAFEALLGVLVLLVTAVLVFLTPARNHPAMDNVAIGETETQR
ncbi:MAG TPA: hypothetical protein VJV03_05680, partial [Pyrinomonadaceae bacterium]|nr:hypothetical protein [Pyrinomonadaceae bacterium]